MVHKLKLELDMQKHEPKCNHFSAKGVTSLSLLHAFEYFLSAVQVLNGHMLPSRMMEAHAMKAVVHSGFAMQFLSVESNDR